MRDTQRGKGKKGKEIIKSCERTCPPEEKVIDGVAGQYRERKGGGGEGGGAALIPSSFTQGRREGKNSHLSYGKGSSIFIDLHQHQGVRPEREGRGERVNPLVPVPAATKGWKELSTLAVERML